jgi:hypothetical protein
MTCQGSQARRPLVAYAVGVHHGGTQCNVSLGRFHASVLRAAPSIHLTSFVSLC